MGGLSRAISESCHARGGPPCRVREREGTWAGVKETQTGGVARRPPSPHAPSILHPLNTPSFHQLNPPIRRPSRRPARLRPRHHELDPALGRARRPPSVCQKLARLYVGRGQALRARGRRWMEHRRRLIFSLYLFMDQAPLSSAREAVLETLDRSEEGRTSEGDRISERKPWRPVPHAARPQSMLAQGRDGCGSTRHMAGGPSAAMAARGVPRNRSRVSRVWQACVAWSGARVSTRPALPRLGPSPAPPPLHSRAAGAV